MARRPLERERIYLDGGRRTTQLMRDSLGSAIPMAPEKTSAQEMALALDEAVAIFATGGIVVTPHDLEIALMQSCGCATREALLAHSWTPDIIVHSVDWDRLPRAESR